MNENLSVSQEKKMENKKNNIKKLFKEYINTKDKGLRNQIFDEYMYIAEILSKKYVNKGVEYDDIFQVASIGLINAIDRFDPSKGFEFTSYATPTILGEIKRYFRDKEWIIRVPRRIQETNREINKARDVLQHKLMRIPKIKDIAEYLDLTEEQVIEAMEGGYAYSPFSLDQKATNTEGEQNLSLFEVLGMEDDKLTKVEERDQFKRAYDSLSNNDKSIIIDRFYNNKSQREIAEEIGVSQMTVSRLEKKIFKKLRDKLEPKDK